MVEKLSIETVEAIFNTLPVDLTFVDDTDNRQVLQQRGREDIQADSAGDWPEGAELPPIKKLA